MRDEKKSLLYFFLIHKIKSQYLISQWTSIQKVNLEMNGMSVTIIKLYIKIPEYLFPKKKTLSNLNKCLFSMKRDKRGVSNINSFSSQVKEYGTVPAGIHRKSPEYGSSIPTGKFPDFFRCIPITFLCFPPGTGRKSPEKVRKFSAGMLLPCSGDFR